jgi:microcystin-dependent protein
MGDRWSEQARRRVYLWAGGAMIAVVCAGALVFASVPHAFKTGDTLAADDLNGNFAAIDQRVAALEALVPAGSIIAYGGPAKATGDGGAPALPPGWLLCDGAAVSRTTYANLFAAVGINFGGGDGIGTFNLPDLRGRFARGLDHGAGIDPDNATRTIGSLQDDAMQPITGTISGIQALAAHGATGVMTAADTGLTANFPGGTPSFNVTFDSAKQVRTSTETRPKNLAVNYIIKS